MAKKYDGSKHFGMVSETPCLPGANSQEISADSELIRDRELIRRSIFNTAGSFGYLVHRNHGGVSRSGLVLPFLSFCGPFWDFPDFSEIFPICSERFLEFPSRVRLGSLKPYCSRHLRLPKNFQNFLPPVRLGTPLFSEVVPERASQSRSWNSQQYWGYF